MFNILAMIMTVAVAICIILLAIIMSPLIRILILLVLLLVVSLLLLVHLLLFFFFLLVRSSTLLGAHAQSDRPTALAWTVLRSTLLLDFRLAGAASAEQPWIVRIGAANGRMQRCRIHGCSARSLKRRNHRARIHSSWAFRRL